MTATAEGTQGGEDPRTADAPARRRGSGDLPARYEDLDLIAGGGSGEVRRVRDTLLERVVAMKVLRAAHVGSPRMRARFLNEAHITAELEHPGIVAVHDRGELADGRLWFVMREVRGRTMREVIEEVHDPQGRSERAPSGFTFRRLVDAFARVAQAVGYAHSRGVVHRDLKPDNLMVGEFGEVLVMDWGLARRGGDAGAHEGGGDEPDEASPALTRHGDVLGTAAYMAPEQARGERDLHGPATDVYALGAVLYHLLSGRPPYAGHGPAAWKAVLDAPPPRLARVTGALAIPAELEAICERAMQRDIAARYPDADALAREVLAWLDGARRREQALAVMEKVTALEPRIAGLRERKAALEAEASRKLEGVKPFDPVEVKAPAWDLQDEAARVGREAALKETEWLEGIHGALSVEPSLPEAHAALADHYRDRLLEAERAARVEDAGRFEVLLRAHDRGRHTALLRGEGALSLLTDPPGASVSLYRYVPERRRLVPNDVGEIGPTPIVERTLERGSYLCVIRAEGRAEVRYPVMIERGAHWSSAAPGDTSPYPIALPRSEELGLDDVYVPAGFCWIGGDPAAMDSLPARRIWIDAFVIRRFPVTNREYLEFLNALIEEGREEEALAACPRDPVSLSGAADARAGKLIYARDSASRFLLGGEEFGRRWREDWPVALVDWHGASAYARWLAVRTGRPWRLPSELEREKAARGVDARLFPWGDHPDATFARTVESDSLPMRVEVTAYPLDESPYGARGLAGNMRDYCLETWRQEGPPVREGRLALEPADPSDPDFRGVRGGAWTSPLERARAATRFGNLPMDRRESIGIRLARSYPG